jgi:hypothetical protein
MMPYLRRGRKIAYSHIDLPCNSFCFVAFSTGVTNIVVTLVGAEFLEKSEKQYF